MVGEQLRVTEGVERGKLLSVEADLLIGRAAPEDEGRLGGDPEISRRHARVSRGANGRLAIEDLGSANGTFVNDERLNAPRTLELGDVIRVGNTVLQVREASFAMPEEPRVPAGPPAEARSVSDEPGQELEVTAGKSLGRRLTVSDELIIGRGVDGQGRLSDDLELSRRHARFTRDESGRLTVEDLGSAHGTFVNGERVRGRRVLDVGDSVRLGLTTLQVSAAAIPPRRPAPPPPPVAGARRPRAPAVPAAGRTPELARGSVIAGCRIEAVINQGEMGVVYRAEELALQRPVALKLIPPEYSSDERFRERFRRESKIAAAIDHPNVIPIFDAGEEQGALYIMMRLVDGSDMRALIAAEGSLEPLRAARIVRQVGAALDAAHARGMLHRDVKPSNVLLARKDHVYLSDFGLAKRAASLEALTRNQTIVARVEYLAPEQILNQRVDARTDIYALGCLLSEALTGEPPFARWSGGPGALAHLDEPPPSPLDLRPDLPREFGEVVRRAMATDPSERYPSAGDLGQAALVAAGGLRRASPWSVVATGEAAPVAGGLVAAAARDAPPAPVLEGAAPMPGGASPVPAGPAGRPDVLRWAIALAALAIVAVGMVAALHGISTL